VSVVAFNATRNVPVATNVAKADTSASRGKGLLGRESIDADEGMWILQPPMAWVVPCPTIHTFFMKFPIDVLFLDADHKVERVIEDLRPWRLSAWVPAARGVLELKGGVLKGSVKVGDRIEMRI
jgi:uncharacterized membrane protein (UPF0127 family)